MEEFEVGEMLLAKEDLVQKVLTKRGNFVVKIANPLDKRRIVRSTASAIGNADLGSIPSADYFYITAVETLKVVLVETPDWFKSVDTCLDDDLIIELYSEYSKFETEFRRRFRQDKFGRCGKTG